MNLRKNEEPSHKSQSESSGKEKKEARKILGISVKSETTWTNMLAIFAAPAISVTAGAYINAQMPFLLQDPDYFGIPFEKVGTTTGQLLFIGSLSSTVLTPFMGYAYDLVGRKYMLITTFVLLTIQLALMPYAAPRMWLLITFRAVMSLLMRIVLVNPLIIDYVKNESRGFAVGLATYGYVFGELVMIMMFERTRKLTMEQQYMWPALIIASMSITIFFLIREPSIKKPTRLPDTSELIQKLQVDQSSSCWNRFMSLSESAWQEVRDNHKYMFCFVCLLVSRLMNVMFAVYIQLWVMSFQKSGVIETQEASDGVYRNIVILAQIATIISLPIVCYVCDHADLRVMIPVTFFIRSLIAGSFRFLSDPNDSISYILCVALVIASVWQHISVEVMFLRHMKKTVRGVMCGIAFFFGAIGTTTFVYVGGILFDRVAPWAPFMVVAGADMFIIVFSIIYILAFHIPRDA